jgi:hypothetical protein
MSSQRDAGLNLTAEDHRSIGMKRLSSDRLAVTWRQATIVPPEDQEGFSDWTSKPTGRTAIVNEQNDVASFFGIEEMQMVNCNNQNT